MTGGVLPRVSFGSWAFAFGPFEREPWSIARICEYLEAKGYDGIEVNGFRPHPHDLDFNSEDTCRVLRDLVAGHGLGVSAYAPDLTDVPPTRVEEMDYLRRIDSARAFCERVGTSILRVDTVVPPRPVRTTPEDPEFQRLARVWRQAAARCKRSGITMVWEFEPGFWLNRPREVVGLLEEVAHPNFKVLFDSSHAYTTAVRCARHGREPEAVPGGVSEYGRLLAPWVGHLHLIDSDGSLHDDDTSTHIPFGEGNIDFTGLLGSLGGVASGLAWWTVDLCFSPRTEEEGIGAVAFVRNLLAGVDGLLAGVDGHPLPASGDGEVEAKGTLKCESQR